MQKVANFRCRFGSIGYTKGKRVLDISGVRIFPRKWSYSCCHPGQHHENQPTGSLSRSRRFAPPSGIVTPLKTGS